MMRTVTRSCRHWRHDQCSSDGGLQAGGVDASFVFFKISFYRLKNKRICGTKVTFDSQGHVRLECDRIQCTFPNNGGV